MGKVIFGFSAFLILFYLISPSLKTFAQTKITPSPTSVMRSEEATPSSKPQGAAPESSARREEYSLPYPGILPDNPLHFLKALRDRIILLLISDPVKEAEFNLLTSDKRIAAASLLADRGKNELSISTLSKSNNYFHNAVSSAAEAKKMGKDIDIVLDTMKKAIVKHQELLSMVKEKAEKDFSNQLQIEEKRMEDFAKSVDNLILK